MTPECCKNCPKHGKDGDCESRGRKCARWRAWFRVEWSRIRRAAAIIKNERGT